MGEYNVLLNQISIYLMEKFWNNQICQICARMKNICQTCILDLRFGRHLYYIHFILVSADFPSWQNESLQLPRFYEWILSLPIVPQVFLRSCETVSWHSLNPRTKVVHAPTRAMWLEIIKFKNIFATLHPCRIVKNQVTRWWKYYAQSRETGTTTNLNICHRQVLNHLHRRRQAGTASKVTLNCSDANIVILLMPYSSLSYPQ
jgi:hypothetical protein